MLPSVAKTAAASPLWSKAVRVHPLNLCAAPVGTHTRPLRVPTSSAVSGRRSVVQLYEPPKRPKKRAPLYDTYGGSGKFDPAEERTGYRTRRKHFPIKYLLGTFDEGHAKMEPVQFRLTDKKEAERMPKQQIERHNSQPGDLRKDYCKQKVSVVSMVLSAYAKKVSTSWLVPVLEEFRDDADVNVFEVNVITGITATRFLRPYLLSTLEKQYTGLQEGIGCATFDLGNKQKERWGMYNPVNAYIFLIDKQGRIRWRASGKPDDREVPMLVAFAKLLKGEQQVQDAEDDAEDEE